jgi:hypothetical protein
MTLHWIEGFETHSTTAQLAYKYFTQTGTYSTKTGRVFGNSIAPNNGVLVTPTLSPSSEGVIGYGFYLNEHRSGLNSTNQQGMHFELGGNGQLMLSPESTSGSGFRFRVMRGSTILATTAYFPFASWVFVEFKAECLTSGGSYEVRVDGSVEVTGSGLDTADSGSDGWDSVAFRYGGNSSRLYIDDIYVLDTTGTSNNDYLGAVVVEGLVPTAEGNSADWGSQGNVNNGLNVGDTSDSTYNKSDTTGDQDLYVYEDLQEIDGTIYGIQLNSQLAMNEVGTRTVKTQYRDPDTTEVDIDTHALSSTLIDSHASILEENPASSTAWTVTDIDDGEFGIEVVS